MGSHGTNITVVLDLLYRTHRQGP